jgi:hypothetical protein
MIYPSFFIEGDAPGVMNFKISVGGWWLPTRHFISIHPLLAMLAMPMPSRPSSPNRILGTAPSRYGKVFNLFKPLSMMLRVGLMPVVMARRTWAPTQQRSTPFLLPVLGLGGVVFCGDVIL